MFTDGPGADEYVHLLSNLADLLAPIVSLDATLALEAADVARKHRLAMADAMVYATAVRHEAELVTSDSDLQGLPGVRFLPK